MRCLVVTQGHWLAYFFGVVDSIASIGGFGFGISMAASAMAPEGNERAMNALIVSRVDVSIPAMYRPALVAAIVLRINVVAMSQIRMILGTVVLLVVELVFESV